MGKQIQLTSVVVLLLLVSSLTSSCKHEKYDSIRDAQDWENPFLIIQGNGVTVVSQNERVLVPVDKLQEYLTNLPDRNWPHGKIVGIADASLRSGNDDELIPRNRQAVTLILRGGAFFNLEIPSPHIYHTTSTRIDSVRLPRYCVTPWITRVQIPKKLPLQ